MRVDASKIKELGRRVKENYDPGSSKRVSETEVLFFVLLRVYLENKFLNIIDVDTFMEVKYNEGVDYTPGEMRRRFVKEQWEDIPVSGSDFRHLPISDQQAILVEYLFALRNQFAHQTLTNKYIGKSNLSEHVDISPGAHHLPDRLNVVVDRATSLINFLEQDVR